MTPDPRLERLTALVARVGGAARWLARLATRAAAVGGAGGLVLWWVTAGDRLGSWWQGTVGSLLVSAFCLAPAAWLVNVRFALLELVELPEKLGGVTTRVVNLRPGAEVDRPDGGGVGAARSVWGTVRDYGDVVGAWGAVAQLVVPSFWLLTAAAFAAVPVVVAVALVAAAVHG
ncbi:MAG: hypothetical protein QOI99_151 [Actinomycetota bacterium]|nr:hypothetical protein [Actinomycetota bacterium]